MRKARPPVRFHRRGDDVCAGGLSIALFATAGFLGLLGIIMLSVAIAYFIHWAGLGLHWSFLIVFAAFGYLRLLRIAFVDPPVFEVVPARLDRGIQAAVGLAALGTSLRLAFGALRMAVRLGLAARKSCETGAVVRM